MANTRSHTRTAAASRAAHCHWIGHRIGAARQLRGWEQDELAQHSGLSRRRIERIEANGDLTCGEVERVAAALRLPVNHFLGPCALCGTHAVAKVRK